MKLCLKFLDSEKWSIYGTTKVFISLLLFILFKQKITTELLIKISILGMMDGDLLPKLVFTCFLNTLIYKNDVHSIITSILSLVSVVISHFYVPYNNKIQKYIENNIVLLMIFRMIVVIWIGYITYNLLNH